MKKTIYILSILLLTISGVSAQTVIKIKQPNPQQITIADDSIKLNGSASVPLSSIIKPITLAEYNAMDAATKLKNAGRQIIDPTGTPTAISIVDGSITESKLSTLVNDKINKIDDVIGEDLTYKNEYYTNEAWLEFVNRYNNSYILGTGFNDDRLSIDEKSAEFVSDPDQYRPIFGAYTTVEQGQTGSEYVFQNERHSLHLAALKAEVTNDVTLANLAANEIYQTVLNNSLNTTFWQDYLTTPERVDNTHQGWIQGIEAKKMLHSIKRLEGIQTTLSNSQIEEVKTWVNDLSLLLFEALDKRLDVYFGEDWEIYGASKFGAATGSIMPSTVFDSEGNTMFDFVSTQDHFNNRNWDVVSFIYILAIENENKVIEEWVRAYFKMCLKFAVFPDGTWWEMIRNTDASPTQGVNYGWTSIGAMVEIAHLDAITNNYPNDKLYNYSTVEGVKKGQTNLMYLGLPFEGSSTTDGYTEKSLLSLIKGQTNYYRSSAFGGWNDTRFYKNSSDELIPLNSEGRKMSVVAALANAFYKDSDLYDYYTFDTKKGYPQKTNTSGGYIAGYLTDDVGSWGNYLIGSLWFQQENNFFVNPVKLDLKGFTTDDIPQGLTNKYGIRSLESFSTNDLKEGVNRYSPLTLIAENTNQLIGDSGTNFQFKATNNAPEFSLVSMEAGEPEINLVNTANSWKIENQVNGRFRILNTTSGRTLFRAEPAIVDYAITLNYIGLGINKSSATQDLDVNGRAQADSFITTSGAPSSSSATGYLGEIRYDDNYIYRHNGTAWTRTPVTFTTW